MNCGRHKDLHQKCKKRKRDRNKHKLFMKWRQRQFGMLTEPPTKAFDGIERRAGEMIRGRKRSREFKA